MKLPCRILYSCLFVAIITLPALSQENNSTPTKDRSSTESKTAGLRKIAGGSQLQNLDIDINIDNEALEASIEVAIANAMKSVENALETLEINIEPIEINLNDLNLDVN